MEWDALQSAGLSTNPLPKLAALSHSTVRRIAEDRGDIDGFGPRPAGALTIRLHHLVPHYFSQLHDRAIRLHCDAGDARAVHRQGALPPDRAVLDQDLRRLVRHGRRLGSGAVL